MTGSSLPEVWLRGPLPGVPALLQPIAHALTQAREDVNAWMIDFPDTVLWERPAGVASVAFHLQHLTGVIDRMFTYARAQALTEQQLEALAAEGKTTPGLKATVLLQQFNDRVTRALEEIKTLPEDILTQPRTVGRQHLPSTVIGLLVHAAEHTQRHAGQLYVTLRIVNSKR